MSGSLLDAMKADAERQGEVVERLANPRNPAQVFVCKLPTDGVKLEAMATAAGKIDKGRGKSTFLHRLIVAACVESIEYGGTAVELDGLAVNFRDPEMQDHLKVKSAADAVKALLVSDGVIASLAGTLLARAGWSEDQFEDPTVL